MFLFPDVADSKACLLCWLALLHCQLRSSDSAIVHAVLDCLQYGSRPTYSSLMASMTLS